MDKMYIPVRWIKQKIRDAARSNDIEHMVKEEVLLELILEWADECRDDD